MVGPSKAEVRNVITLMVYAVIAMIFTLGNLIVVIVDAFKGVHNWFGLGLALFLAATGLWAAHWCGRKMGKWTY